jgi:hypothetical protein
MALFLDLEYVLSIVCSPLYSMEITYCVWSGLYHLLVEMLILIGLGVCIIFIFLEVGPVYNRREGGDYYGYLDFSSVYASPCCSL